MRHMLKRFCVVKMKYFVIAVVVISVYMFISYVALDVWIVKNNKNNLLSVELPNVIVHIDLKGTPLKLTYLRTLLPVLKKHGVTGLLMEYEDMFPYHGKLKNLSAEYHYDKSELKRFISVARSKGFEIIPLIQTFGHLEYALKLEEFQHLREIDVYPDSICPSRMESNAFLIEMIEQIVNLHATVGPLKYIHIGCDEVFHVNECAYCKQRNKESKDLLIQHIKQLSEVVKSLSPDTTVLIWDDMLREIKPGEWNDIEPFTNVHPVYWDYGSNLQITHHNLMKYHKKFPHIWLASAYKGADGKTAVFPDLKKRFLNHFSWMNLILGYTFGGENKIYNFKGIILTGWSRYSHMDPPCELLPVSIPSLILNLLVIQKFKSGISDVKDDDEEQNIEHMFKKHLNVGLSESLKCNFNLDSFDFNLCEFDGKDLFSSLHELTIVENDVNNYINSDKNSIQSIEFYSKLEFMNMNNVVENRAQLKINLDEILQLEGKIDKEMSYYFDKDFVIEYINYKSFQLKTRIVNLMNILDIYTRKRVWKRRSIRNQIFFPIEQLIATLEA